MKKLLTIITFVTISIVGYGQLKHNSKKPMDPATQPIPEHLKGTVITGTIDFSLTYPSTKRKIQVFVLMILLVK